MSDWRNKNNKRIQRVAELIKVNIGGILQREYSGKLPGMATVMQVELSKDLQYAKVYVSLYGEKEVKKDTLSILKHRVREIRMSLSRAVNLRQCPEITFIEDTSLDRAFRINELLDQINKDKQNSSGDSGS